MISKTLTKQLILLGAIIALGMIIFYHLYSFVPAALGAFTVFVVGSPYYDKLLKKKVPSSIAALIIMLITALIIFVPLVLVVQLMSGKISNLVSHANEYFIGLKELGNRIKEYSGFDILNEDFINGLKTSVAKYSGNVLNFTVDIFTSFFMTFLILFFLFINEDSFKKYASENNPFSTKNYEMIKQEIKKNIYSNAIMIPLIAFFQGILLYVGYLIFGVQDALFWGIISMFACIVPFVGGALVWLPLGLALIASGHTAGGIGLMLYSMIIVGSSDNILRIFLQSRFSDAHPLITIFGVIIGLNIFGFIGLIFGPILISLFLLLIKVYNNEFFKTKIP